MKKLIIAAVFVLAAASGVKAAGMEVGKVEVGIGPAVSIPLGCSEYKDAFKSSFAMDIYGQYQIHEMIAVGLDLGYDFGHKSKVDGMDDLKFRVLQVTPFAKYEQPFELGGKKATWYGKAGLGLYRWSTPEFTIDGTTIASDSGSKFGFNLGVGATMEVASNISIGLDVTAHFITSAYTTEDGDKMITPLTPSLRGIYRF